MNAHRFVQLLVVLACIFSVTCPIQADTTIFVPPSHPIPIAQASNVDELMPVVAYDPGRQQFLIAYDTHTLNTHVVKAACLNQTGEVIATYTIGDGHNPDIVYDTTNDIYVVVWEQPVPPNSSWIEGITVAGECCVAPLCTGVPFVVSGDRPGIESRPAIANNSHGERQDFLIVWTDYTNFLQHVSVWGRRMDGTSLVAASFPIVNPEGSYNSGPDVAYNLNINEFMVVFVRDPSNISETSDCDIYGVRILYDAGSPSGLFVATEQPIDTHSGEQLFPRIAAYPLNLDTPYLVIYRDKWADLGGDIYGCLVNQLGVCVQWVDISSQPDKVETNPAISSSEVRGGYTVIWQEQPEEGDSDVMWRNISHDGVTGTVGMVTGDPLDNNYPDIINSIPFPFAVWATRNVGDNFDIYGRFLYEKTFIPLVLRNR